MTATRTMLTVVALAAAAAVPAGEPSLARVTPVAAATATGVDLMAADPVVGQYLPDPYLVEADPVLDYETEVEPAAAAAPVPRWTAAPGARFRTPEAAMRHLATAYNRRDTAALRTVTTPHARRHLEDMRSISSDLRLRRCVPNGDKTYTCDFTHAYPGQTERGYATVVVSPAAKPGWYMSSLLDCG
jgi:hypothetical protein